MDLSHLQTAPHSCLSTQLTAISCCLLLAPMLVGPDIACKLRRTYRLYAQHCPRGKCDCMPIPAHGSESESELPCPVGTGNYSLATGESRCKGSQCSIQSPHPVGEIKAPASIGSCCCMAEVMSAAAELASLPLSFSAALFTPLYATAALNPT